MHQAFYYRGIESTEAAMPPAAASPAAIAAAAHACVDAALTATPASPPRACRQGCSACCHHLVGVTFAEAVRLLQAVAQLPPAPQQALRANVLAAAAPGQSWEQLAALAAPCPLLQHGACAVYAHRPLPCRALFSADAQACSDALLGKPRPQGVPFDAEAFVFGLGAAAALAGANSRRGWPAGSRELRSALCAMLQSGDGAGEGALAAAFQNARPAGGDPAAAGVAPG